MEKEFNLSDEVCETQRGKSIVNAYLEEDVKKFIKKEGELIAELYNGHITWNEYLNRRSKLAGEELSS